MKKIGALGQALTVVYAKKGSVDLHVATHFEKPEWRESCGIHTGRKADFSDFALPC